MPGTLLKSPGSTNKGRASMTTGTIGQHERKLSRARLREEGCVFSDQGRDARQPFERCASVSYNKLAHDVRKYPMQATILVVDDTPSNIAVLTEILRGDYRVLAAING